MHRSSECKHAFLDLLTQDLRTAQEQLTKVSSNFREMVQLLPSGTLRPDDVAKVRQAFEAYSRARDGLDRARARLYRFLDKGIMPEDLREASGHNSPPGDVLGLNGT